MNTSLVTRRRLLCAFASVGSVCIMSNSGCSHVMQETAQDYEPTGPIHWLESSFFWIGALKSKSGVKYVLIQKDPSIQASILREVGGPILCRQGVEPYLLAKGLNQTDSIKVVSRSSQVDTVTDHLQVLSDCQFANARAREELIQKGFKNLTSASIGSRYMIKEAHETRAQLVLACRPIGSEGASELIVFDFSQNTVISRKIVTFPLSLDNPVLVVEPHSNHWIAYPSFTFKRRQSLMNSLPGIPVWRVSNGLDLSLAWVGWDEWNLNGPYRFFPLKTSFVAAMSLGWTNDGYRLSGIYFPEHGQWVRRFNGQVDITSLAVSADQRYLGWTEQIKEDPPSALYGKLRQIVRIEHIPPVESIWQPSNTSSTHSS